MVAAAYCIEVSWSWCGSLVHYAEGRPGEEVVEYSLGKYCDHSSLFDFDLPQFHSIPGHLQPLLQKQLSHRT